MLRAVVVVMMMMIIIIIIITVLITVRSVGIHFVNDDFYFRFYRNFSVLLQ